MAGSIDERIIETLGRKLGLVEGSVLEPSTVLGTSAQIQHPLFTEMDLEKELKHARLLARAVEFSSSIIPEDYELLLSIDETFCSANEIRTASKVFPQLQWLSQDSTSGRWQTQINKRSAELNRLISLYSH